MAAGNLSFFNIKVGDSSGLRYNMLVYKTIIPNKFVHLATFGRDSTIRQEHIETAFASFPAFCGDAKSTDDKFVSCQKDIAGFLFYLQMRDWKPTIDQNSDLEFYQQGLANVIDDACFAITTANSQMVDISGLTAAQLDSKTLQACQYWKDPTAPDQYSAFPEYSGAYYFSRGGGPLPLIGPEPYSKLSVLLFGEKQVLAKSPYYVEDPRLLVITAMWGYMGYGLNGSNGPSIHDIFTGHWSPNAAEQAAGYISPINAALGVVASRHASNPDKTKTCKDIFQVDPKLTASDRQLGQTYFAFASQLGLQVDTSQDITCSSVNAYPELNGVNRGYYLQYDSNSGKCELSNTPTAYHAFRSGDLRLCLKDGEAKGNYVAAAAAVKSTVVYFTDWTKNYPYVIGSYASLSTDTGHKPLQCLKPIACATNEVPASPNAIWGAKDASKEFSYYDPALIIVPDQVTCTLYTSIASQALAKKAINLLRQDPFYICDGTPRRVFQCVATTQDTCLAQAPSDANLTSSPPVWKAVQATGLDPFQVTPKMYCAEDGRSPYEGNENLNIVPWLYDFGRFEFKNGSVCSYDRTALKLMTAGFYVAYNTPTGLTNDQLAVTNGNAQFTPYTQSSLATVNRQEIWKNFNSQVLTSNNKDVLLTTGVLPANKEKQRWQYANNPSVSPVRSTLRQLRDLTVDGLTNQDFLDFKLDLDWYFDNQLDVATAANIAKDIKRDWNLATVGYKDVANTANVNTSQTQRCGVSGDKECTASGFKYDTYSEITNDVFRTGGCPTIQVQIGNEYACEQLLIQQLAALTLPNDVTAKQREWLRNVITYKYLNGSGDSGEYKLRTTIQNGSNTRSSILQYTKPTTGQANYFPKPTYLAANSWAVLKAWMPIYGNSGTNTAELYWVLDVDLTRKEIVEAVPFAYMMKQYMYPTSNSLTTQEQTLFITQSQYSALTLDSDKIAYVKVHQQVLPNLGAEAATTAALLQKQLGVIAIALLRPTVGVTNKKFMLGGAGASITLNTATAISPYEKVICKFYKFQDYLNHPLSQTDLISVVTYLRTNGALYTTQMTATGYDYNVEGNSYYTSIAQQYWATITTAKPVFSPATYATNSIFPTTFLDDLIADAPTASQPWRSYTTAQMYQKLDDAMGYKKCFETYFNKVITYKDSTGAVQTLTGPDPFEAQKYFMKSNFFPWMVSNDITTKTGANNDAQLLNTASMWFVHNYKRHPIQFYSMLEMACVITTATNIANNKSGSTAGDPVKQILADTIDSVAVQKIADQVFKMTTYVDLTNANQAAVVDSIGAGYTAANTHPLMLKYAVAYAAVKTPVTPTQDYVTYDRFTFGLYFRPEWLWWAQIPFESSGINSGIKNVKFEYDRLLSINQATIDSAVQPLYYTPTVLNGDFSFGSSTGTDGQKLLHFKSLSTETQKQVCAMQALVLYNRYYKPSTKQIDYNDSALYGSLEGMIAKYAPTSGGFSDILALIKPMYKFGVVASGSNLTPLKQNMLWFFARQLDANIDYTTDITAQANISAVQTTFNLALYATSTTGMTSGGKTTELGIGVLSLSYAITGLMWNYSEATAITTAPVPADYDCATTESDTVIPICVPMLVQNYLYDEQEVYSAVIAWKNRRPIATIGTQDFLTHIRVVRGDRRFRLNSQFYSRYQEWNKVKRLDPRSTSLDSQNLVDWIALFTTYKLTIGDVFSMAGTQGLQDLQVMTSLASQVFDYKLKWANGGVACDSTCLDSTGAPKAALLSHENLVDSNGAAPTTVKQWLWLKIKQIYDEQFSKCGTTTTTSINTENAFIFYDYDEKYWPYLDKGATEIEAMIQTARATPKGPLYKDFWSQPNLKNSLMYNLDDITLRYTYDDLIDGNLQMKSNNYELMLMALIGASNTSTTLPRSQTNWYLYDQANIVDYLIPRFPGHYLTEGALYKAITSDAKRRDKINDLLFVAKKWNTDYGTGDQTQTQVFLQMTPASTFLVQPSGTAAVNLGKKFHAFLAVEDIAFREHHAIEMPDAYELEFIKWSEENTEANFNSIVRYTTRREWFQKLYTFEIRGQQLQDQTVTDLQRVSSSFATAVGSVDWVAVRGQMFGSAPSIILARSKMLKVAATDFQAVILSLGQLAETRANLIAIDTENILVANAGDYVKFAMDFYLTKSNLYSILDFYYSFKSALDQDVNASTGSAVTTQLTNWLTTKGVTFEQVKGWVETNGLTTAVSGFAKQLDSLGSVTSLDSLIPIAKASALNSAKLAFRIAILNFRDSRNDPRYGDGYTMQTFAGVQTRNIPASWESTTIQAIYDTTATPFFKTDEFAMVAEMYLRQCHATGLTPTSFSGFTYIKTPTTWPTGLSATSTKEQKCFVFAKLKFQWYGWKSITYNSVISNTDLKWQQVFCDPTIGINTYQGFASKYLYSSSDLAVIQDVAKQIAMKANNNSPTTKFDAVTLKAAVDMIAAERANFFSRSKDIKMTKYAPQATSGIEYRKIFSCPAQLLHLAHANYENREIKVNDPLIQDDSGKNRFLWFAKWNLVTYYSHAPADLTLTTTALTVPTTGSLYDQTGSLTTPDLWTSIDKTLPFGQQLGWLVFNMYESVIPKVSGPNLINSAPVQPYELEIFGISAEDILLRELTVLNIFDAVVAMRNIVNSKYNLSTPTRQFTLVATDTSGITWADPVAKTAAAPLTSAIVASSGISPEFFAGLSVLQLNTTFRTVSINSWVYQSSTPSRRFWGRTTYLTTSTPISRNDWNNLTWFADKIYQALELGATWVSLSWNPNWLTTIVNDEIATEYAANLASATWLTTTDADKVLTAFNIFRLVQYERQTKKHSVEKLTLFEKAMLYAAIDTINSNDHAYDLLLDKDITNLELEQIGQQLRTPDWINGLICTTATACLSTNQQAALFVDAAGLKQKQYTNLLRDRIVGLEQFRAPTWTNPYLSLMPTGTMPNAYKTILKTYLSDFDPKRLVQVDYHYPEWKMVTDDAMAKRGATILDGLWAEMELLRQSSNAVLTATDTQIAAAKLFDGSTAIVNKATLYSALSKANAVITPQIAAEKIAGPIALAALQNNASYKYLNYGRRWYSETIVKNYFGAKISLDGVAPGNKFVREAQIALNLFARQKRAKDTAFNFAVADDGKFGSQYTAPQNVNGAGWTDANVGAWALEKAKQAAFTVEPFTWDYNQVGYTPADFGFDNLATLYSKGIHTASELLWLKNVTKQAKGACNDSLNQCQSLSAMGVYQIGLFFNQLGTAVGRESKGSYTNAGKVFFGDYNYKPSSHIVRPTRSSLYDWTQTKNVLQAAPYNYNIEQAFKNNPKLADWTLFRDEFVSGQRVGANFQGSEDFSYLLKRAQILFDAESKLWSTPPTMDYFINQAINEVSMRDFEFWQPWTDSNIVKGTFKCATGQAHADVSDWLSVYLFVNGMGSVNDNTLQGRLWLTRAMKAAKTILQTQYNLTPLPAQIRKVDILDKYGCKADGTWKVATSNLPNPTLKQQIGFIVAEYMFAKPFDLTAARVTDANGTKPAIDFQELEFLGINDITPLLKYQNWQEAGIQTILAKWADRVKAQASGRTTTGTPVLQGANPAPSGTLPSDTEIAAVTGWVSPSNVAWTYSTLIDAGYSDWAIAAEYVYFTYKNNNKTPLAAFQAPMFYADYSGEALADGCPAGEKLVDSWNSYFGTLLSIQDVLTYGTLAKPKYTWADMNDMYTYAQYLYRSQRFTRPEKDLPRLKKVIADANLSSQLQPTSPLDVTKNWAGLIAFTFFNQPHHAIQIYNDYELSAFNPFKAQGFNEQGIYNQVKDNFWTNEDIQLIIEGARKLTIDYNNLTSLTLQSNVVGTEQYAKLYNVNTFNSAVTNVDRMNAVQSLQLTQAFLKIQTQIVIHKQSYPKQATESEISSFYTLKNQAYNQDANYALTFHHGKSNSDFYNYNIRVEDITKNFLIQQSMLDIINIADFIASTGADNLPLTFSEQTQIGYTQAQFNALTLAERNLIAGPIALARFKSKKSNASPNRVYNSSVVLAYGLNVDQLNKLQWQSNESQYVLYLSSNIPTPLQTIQIMQIQADYAKLSTDSTKKLTTQLDFTTAYSQEVAIGQLAILQFDRTAYTIWNGSEPKPTNVFVQRSIDKFGITLDFVITRCNLKRKGWEYVLNQAWDYSQNSDAIAAGASRQPPPYQESSLLTEDQKAMLLALDDLKNNAGFTATEKQSDIQITSTYAGLGLYGFTPLWIMANNVDATTIDELYAFSVFLKVRYTSTLLSELLAGQRVRAMFVTTTTPASTTSLIYNGMTEYQLARFGKLIYESATDPNSSSLWTACSPYSPKPNRLAADIDVACRKLNYIVSTLVKDLSQATQNYVVAYSFTDSRKAAYDTVQAADTTYYPANNATPPPSKYLYGALLVAKVYDDLQKTQQRLVSPYNYKFADILRYWISKADLQLIDAKLQDIAGQFYQLGTADQYASLDIISTIRGTGVLSNLQGAANPSKICDSGCPYTAASSSFMLFANSNKQNWSFNDPTTVLPINPLTEIKALGNSRYVSVDALGNINYDATATLLKAYLVDVAATEDEISKKMFFLDLTYAQFVAIFTTVNELETISQSSANPTPPRVDIIRGKFADTDIAKMTWKRQFFEIALFMHTDRGTTGLTEMQYKKYGLDYYVRTKLSEQGRATDMDLLNVYNSAVARCALADAFTNAELAKIASLITFKSTTVTREEQCGALNLQNFIISYNRQAVAEQFGYSTLQKTYKQLTDSYRALFTNLADSYEFSYVSPQLIALNTVAGYAAPSKDQMRGILTIQKLVKSYPSFDFYKSPIPKEQVLTSEQLTRFGMTLDWYMQKFYNQEEMRYLVRQAQKMREGQPTLEDLTFAGVTVSQFLEMRYTDFCRIYAEAKLSAATGPQVLNDALYKGGVAAVAPYYSDVVSTSKELLQYCGLDVYQLVVQGIKPSFVKSLVNNIYNRSVELDSDVTNFTTTAISQLAYSTCGVDPNTLQFSTAVVSRSQLAVSVAQCQYLTAPKKVPSLNYSQATVTLYGITDETIQALSLTDADLYDLINKANAILTGINFDPTKPWKAGSTLPTFTAQQVLLHEYTSPTSATYNRATALTKRATNNGLWSTKSPHAIAFTIVLNCRQFVTANRLTDYGADIAWYWQRWLTYLDFTEVLVLADRLNSLDITTWVTTGLTLPQDYALLDKPKKSLTVAWLRYVADALPVQNSPNTIITYDVTKFVSIGLNAFDLAFNRISKSDAQQIAIQLDSYNTSWLKGQDSYIPGVAGQPQAQALKAMILYQWKALPVGDVEGLDAFTSNLFSYEKYGLTAQQIRQDIDQKLLFPYSYERILAKAIALAADNAFPSQQAADYYSYGLLDGTTALNSYASANTFGKNRFAGLVAREWYLRNLQNNLANRYAVPDEIKESDFWSLQIAHPGLKDSDAQAFYKLYVKQRDKNRTVDQLYLDAGVTSATVGKQTSEQLLGLLAYADFKTANPTRNFEVVDAASLTANSAIYGIDFSNFSGRWYSVGQLSNVIDNAVAIYSTFVLMKDPTVALSIGRFTTDQLAIGQFKTTEQLTNKQRAGVIALRQYDIILKERGATIADQSIVTAQKIPRMRSDIVNLLAGTTEPNYKPADATLYGIDFVSIMLKSTKLQGIFDIYATIDLADYLCRVYDTSATINDLHTFLGSPVTTWGQISVLQKSCGALASQLVNSPLYTDSSFTVQHAVYMDIDTIAIPAADQPKTEYNLAVAWRELSVPKTFSPVEDIFTGKAYIDTHSSKYTKVDLYTKVLPLVLTWASRNYYWVKGRLSQTSPEFKLSLPLDPVPSVNAWQPGHSMKYGVYSSVAVYPGLDYSSDKNSNIPRDAVFESVRNQMATPGTKLSDALKKAVDAQVITTPSFKPTQQPLRYSKADIDKFLPTDQSKLLTHEQTNAIMAIAKDQLYTNVFNNGVYFVNGVAVSQWTSYKGMLDFLGIEITKIRDDSVIDADKTGASLFLGKVASKLYFYKRLLYQIVDVALTADELTTYGISSADINDNNLSVDMQHITLDLAKQFEPYVGTSTDVGFLSANVTDKYPLGIPATETSKKIAWKVALEFFIQNKSRLVPALYVMPMELQERSIDELTALGVTLQDIIDGKENSCTIRAKDLYNQLIMAQSKGWLDNQNYLFNVKKYIIDADPNLSGNDRTDDESIAKQIAWLQVTAIIGQYPRTYAHLMKITSRIQDVCDMTESDLMRLTGKAAYRNVNGQYDVAMDYHGNVIQSECSTFGNDNNGVFKYTADDVAKIGIPFEIAQTQFETEQIRQYLCTYSFMQDKLAKKKARQAMIAKMTDSQKYTYYGYPNERMIDLIGMSHDAIAQDGISFEQMAEFVFKATWTTGPSFSDFSHFDKVAIHAGLTRQMLNTRNLDKFEQTQLITNFINYSDIYSRQVVDHAKLLRCGTGDCLARFELYYFTNTISTDADTSLVYKQRWIKEQNRVCLAEFTQNLVPGIANANQWQNDFYLNGVPVPAYDDKTFKDPLGNNQKYCNMFTSQDSYYYKVGPTDSKVSVPKTNVDIFLLVLSKQKFESDVDLKNINGLNINSVYSYENLLNAVAKFPAFCSVDGTVADCKKQVSAFLAVTKQLTTPDGGGQALNKVEETCTPVAGKTDCLYYPDVESADFHWLGPIIERYQKLGLLNFGTVQYKARGAGMIQGAAEYYRFAKSVGFVDFKLISGPDTTIDATGAFVVNGEQHTKAVLGPDGQPVAAAKQPYAFVSHSERYDSIDLSYAKGMSFDDTWVPLMNYRLFFKPELASTAEFAWATGLWKFLTPVSHSYVEMFTERQQPSTIQKYVYFESTYWSPAPSSWLLGHFKPRENQAIPATPWTGSVYSGFRGVLKSYFPTECLPNSTDAKVTNLIASYNTFKTLTIVFSADNGTNVDDCSGTISGPFQKDLNFLGPFYFSASSESTNAEQKLTRKFAKPGTCFTIYTPTAHTVFEPGAYKQCVVESYVKNFKLPGLNNAQS